MRRLLALGRVQLFLLGIAGTEAAYARLYQQSVRQQVERLRRAALVRRLQGHRGVRARRLSVRALYPLPWRRGLLNGASQLAVVGDELYVCDTSNDRLQVFSLTGEHRRSITGAWRLPLFLCGAKDRLYLTEQGDELDAATPREGRRILVLSLQGDVLQVVTHPTERGAVFTSICCFDRKLLAAYRYYNDTERRTEYGVLALRGL